MSPELLHPLCGSGAGASIATMRHRLEALVPVAVLLAALLACKGGSKGTSSTSDPGPGAPPAEAALPVKAADLLGEYTGNEVRGDAKYKGKLVDVVGFIGDIKKDAFDNAFIELHPTPNMLEFNTVHCKLAPGQEGPAAALNKGEAIILRGRVDGLVLGSVWVSDCAVGKRGKDLPPASAPAQPAQAATPAKVASPVNAATQHPRKR